MVFKNDQTFKNLLRYEDETRQGELSTLQVNNSTEGLSPLLAYENESQQDDFPTLSTTRDIAKHKKPCIELNHETDAKSEKIISSSNIEGNIVKGQTVPFNSTLTNTKFIKEDSIVLDKKSNLLKSKKDPKINIEMLKRHVLKHFQFIYCDDMRFYDITKGYYKKVSYHEVAVKINSIIDDNTKQYVVPADIKETYKALKYEHKIQVDTESTIINNEFYINCCNGVLNLNNLICNCYPVIEPHNPNKFFFNCINANYVENHSIEGSYFENFLNTITGGDISLKKLLQQVMGYIISNLNNAKKAFILYGISNSGKSVLLKVLTFLCGEENVSNVSLHNLSNEKYTAELFGKTINICSELPDKDLTDIEIFKSLTSETDKVSARFLYGNPFSFYNKAKLIFATNNLPNIKTNNYKDNAAFFNRLIIVPFKFSIPEYKQDKNLVYRLLAERNLIFTWALNGLVDYIKNNFSFISCQSSEFELKNYTDNGNTMLKFINSRCAFISESYIHISALFDAYVRFCQDYCFDLPKQSDKKHLKSLLIDKFNLQFKRLNRSDGNKYGFVGICLRNYY